MNKFIKLTDNEIESFFIKGQRNPCGCGSNLYHQVYNGEHLYGVCNACKRYIYEIEYDEEYIKNSEWRDVSK